MERPSRFPLWVLCAVAGLGSLAPAVASAQTEVIVLGIRSLEGDDEFARNLTGALRNEATQVNDWTVSDREVTLAQLVLAHGCDEPNVECMAQIADSLNIDRILYGEVRRTTAGEDYSFGVELHLFDAETDSNLRSVNDTIPQIRRDIDDLREPARRYVAALSGAPQLGTARIVVGVANAEVFIDDASVGVTSRDGVLVAENVESGTRAVRVEAEGYQPFSGSVTIEPYAEATLEGELVGIASGGGPNDRDILIGVGTAVTVAGVVLAALWAGFGGYYYFELYGSRADVYRQMLQRPDLPMGSDDFCDDIAMLDGTVQGAAQELCNEMEPYPYMVPAFGIAAIVVGGVGLGMLIAGLTSDDGSADRAFRLEPSLSPDHAYLGATFAF